MKTPTLLALLAIVLLFADSLWSQAQPSQRFALVIGNGAYAELNKLPNPVNDATDMKVALDKLGFQVDRLLDADLASMEDAVARLGRKLASSKDSIGFFFYAGHGVQSDGVNYLIPVDAHIAAESFLKARALAAQSVLDTLGDSSNALNIIVLDACRDNPFSWSRSASRGLKISGSQPPGSIIAYSTSEGKVAQDGTGRNGVFTAELIKHINTPGIDIKEVFDRTGAGVQSVSNNVQIPAINSQFFGKIYLAGAKGGGASSSAATFGYGDLMVSASIAGAEILVDGVSRGKAPLLLKQLEAGKALKVEARSGLMAAIAEVKLNAGELREVSLSLSRLKGNLIVASNEKEVSVWIDGEGRGPIGSGVLRDIPSGDHRLELRGTDLYYSGNVTIPPNETAKVDAVVKPTGRLELSAPPDVKFTLKSADGSWSGTGSVSWTLFANSFTASASGPGYDPAQAVIVVPKGGSASWTPYSKGSLAFAVQPAGASYSIEGLGAGAAAGELRGLAPGSYELLLRYPGFRDRRATVLVAAGKASRVEASLERLAQASLSFPSFGVALGLDSADAPGAARRGDSGGVAEYSIPAGIPISLSFSSPYAERIGLPTLEADFDEGSARDLELPSGRFLLPWLPKGGAVSIGSAKVLALANEASSGFRSPALPPGEYLVKVGGEAPWSGRVEIKPDGLAEPAGYREAMASAVATKRTGYAKQLSGKRLKTAAGWASLSAGVAGAAGAGIVYALGAAAKRDYDSAADTAAAIAARGRAELYDGLFPAAAALCGVGLGLSPILFLGGPDPEVLQRSIDALDEGIQALGK